MVDLNNPNMPQGVGIIEVEFLDGTVVATPDGLVPGDRGSNRVMQLRYEDGSVWNVLAAENLHCAG